MAEIRLVNVSKRFGKIYAVKDVNIRVADGEFLVLVGPSGCGKSTTLRMIAGLEDVSDGEIYIGDKMVNDLTPKDRDIAMVFQEYALYPHMNVYNNMSFGLKMRRFPKKEINARVREAAEILGISHLLSRKPRELSGGERQRVALGRAIVRKPTAFLFDEPLSNLDAKLRFQMREELIRLYNRLKATIIYVTHDQVEAMTMGTKIAVMNRGEIQQVGSPLEVYRRPINKFVAGFIGSPSMNFFDSKIINEGDGLFIDTGSFKLQIPKDMGPKYNPLKGKEVILGIRPPDIIHPKSSVERKITSHVDAEVEMIEPLGSETLLFVKSSDTRFIVKVDSGIEVTPGQEVRFLFDMERIHIFDTKPPLTRLLD